ncbi:MAG: peptidylprolyl isomerase [Thermodesulfobacteriota bacterium]
MMRKENLRMITYLLFPLLLLGCGEHDEKKLGKNELVRVNEVSITLEDFHQISENQPLEGKLRLLSEKGQRDFLENYVITREVLYQEAKKRGVDKDKRILSKVEDYKRAMVIDALLEEVLKGKDQVTESEIEQYYKENKNRFTEPREVKIRQIFVTSEPILKEVLKKLSKGESFEKLASTYNVGQFREDGGNLGYIRRGQLAPPFAQIEEAAFSLREKGEISEVIKTSYGYHILRLEDKIGTLLRPLPEVKEKIRFFLQAKKRQDAYLEYVKEVKSKSKIVVNEKLWAEEGKKEQKSTEEKK